MVAPPHAAINAPSGPRNLHTLTLAEASSGSRPEVQERIRYPLVNPARIPHNWISMCAGVQNVSRPMDMCQEMSQEPPITTDTTAPKSDHTYHGTAVSSPGACAASCGEVRATDSSVEAMPVPKLKVAQRARKIEMQCGKHQTAALHA